MANLKKNRPAAPNHKQSGNSKPAPAPGTKKVKQLSPEPTYRIPTPPPKK